MTEGEAIARRLVDELWGQRNPGVLDELIAPDFVLHDPSILDLPKGPEGARQYYQMFVAGFPDIQVNNDEVVASGDFVAALWTAHGTHDGEAMGIPPTGRQITITGQALYRVANGQIVEEWVHADIVGLLKQLGAIPD